MASRRRRRKTIGKVVSDVERRVRVVEKRPGAKRIKRNVVTAEKIQYRSIVAKNITTDGVTPNEVSFGVPVISDTQPTEYLKSGTLWINPDDGAAAAYDFNTEAFIPITDTAAYTLAAGKNTIYYSSSAPTGGTYAVDDTWFDTDDGYKMYTWTGSAWSGFELGNSALASISAAKISAGSLAANVILTSSITAGQISAGTINVAIEMTSATITGGLIRTSATGERMEITNSDQINFYNSSGVISGRISPYAEAGYDSGLHVGDGTGSFFAGLYVSSDFVHLAVDNQGSLSFLPEGIVTLDSSSLLTLNSSSLIGIEAADLVTLTVGSTALTLDSTKAYLDVSSPIFSSGLRNIEATFSFTPSTDTSGGVGDIMLVYTP